MALLTQAPTSQTNTSALEKELAETYVLENPTPGIFYRTLVNYINTFGAVMVQPQSDQQNKEVGLFEQNNPFALLIEIANYHNHHPSDSYLIRTR